MEFKYKQPAVYTVAREETMKKILSLCGGQRIRIRDLAKLINVNYHEVVRLVKQDFVYHSTLAAVDIAYNLKQNLN